MMWQSRNSHYMVASSLGRALARAQPQLLSSFIGFSARLIGRNIFLVVFYRVRPLRTQTTNQSGAHLLVSFPTSSRTLNMVLLIGSVRSQASHRLGRRAVPQHEGDQAPAPAPPLLQVGSDEEAVPNEPEAAGSPPFGTTSGDAPWPPGLHIVVVFPRLLVANAFAGGQRAEGSSVAAVVEGRSPGDR